MKKIALLLVALTAFLTGLFLAFHYPLGGVLPLSLFTSYSIFAFFRSSIATPIAIAAMPIMGFAPWTGWITFEEFDLLVLAIASGGSFRAFLERSYTAAGETQHSRLPRIAILLMVILGLSLIVALYRGVADAGGFVWGWYQGYYEPMNSLRLAKSFCWALVLLLIWLGDLRRNSEAAMHRLATCFALGLGLASLAAIWERLAFTGLLNFSEDYRTTALFWEMHVGGAAFDGFLALTVPFAVWMFLRSHTKQSALLFGGILALAGYAALTTFSRGVYLAIPIGLSIMGVIAVMKRPKDQALSLPRGGVWVALSLLAYFSLAASLVFPTSGYRGMLAVLIAMLLFCPVAIAFSSASRQDAWRVFGMATALAILIAIVVGLLPKGAYGVFAIGVAGSCVGLMVGNNAGSIKKLLLTLAGYLSALIGCVLIAAHWGGADAAETMAWVVPLMVLALPVGRLYALPSFSGHWHAGLGSSMLTVCLAIATFSGGAYMGNRFSTSSQDFDSRIQHWRAGLGQLEGLDWWFGKGLGRYPVTHFFAAPPSEHPGGYRLESNGDQSWLSLSGGKHINGWGEIFRVTQRISPGLAPYRVSFAALAEKPVQLHFEVCEKHLLYNAACVVREVPVKAIPDQWQKISADLQGTPPGRGAWFAPRIVAFSVAMETRGGSVKLDDLALSDGAGNNLLVNGDFSDGLAQWFSSSDKHHMPWHMKSLFFHVLFDQGVLGLSLVVIMIFAAIFRLTAGQASKHPLATPILGSICGFLVVGLFDTLVDAPRLAVLFYFLLLIGLTVRLPSQLKFSGRKQSPEPTVQGT